MALTYRRCDGPTDHTCETGGQFHIITPPSHGSIAILLTFSILWAICAASAQCQAMLARLAVGSHGPEWAHGISRTKIDGRLGIHFDCLIDVSAILVESTSEKSNREYRAQVNRENRTWRRHQMGTKLHRRPSSSRGQYRALHYWLSGGFSRRSRMAVLIAGRLGCGGGPLILFPPLACLRRCVCRKAKAIIVISACRCSPLHVRPSK